MFNRKLKKEYDKKISILEHEIAELTEIVKTQELLKLRKENARLKEKEELISKVKFRVRDAAYLPGDEIILVKYEIPPLKIQVSEDKEIIKNDVFYAINKLGLISLDDAQKLVAVIKGIKEDK